MSPPWTSAWPPTAGRVCRCVQVAFHPDEDVPGMLGFFNPPPGLVGPRDRILARAQELVGRGFSGFCCMVGDDRGLAAPAGLAVAQGVDGTAQAP